MGTRAAGGEGNGNPVQCSCLEDPRDGGAWWAAIYGVAQSWTQLKRLSRAAGVFLKNEDSLKYSSNVFFLLNDSFLVVIKWCMESCSSHQEHQFMILLDTSWETS